MRLCTGFIWLRFGTNEYGFVSLVPKSHWFCWLAEGIRTSQDENRRGANCNKFVRYNLKISQCCLNCNCFQMKFICASLAYIWCICREIHVPKVSLLVFTIVKGKAYLYIFCMTSVRVFILYNWNKLKKKLLSRLKLSL